MFFCIRLVAGLIGTILMADQQPAYSSLFEVLVSALSLGAVIVLTNVLPGSLFWLGACMSGAMVLVPIVGNVWLFRGRYREFSPRCATSMRSRAWLMHIGVQFFFLQIAGLVLFTGSNLIIAQLFGPKESLNTILRSSLPAFRRGSSPCCSPRSGQRIRRPMPAETYPGFS